jgi:hypothetical protein
VAERIATAEDDSVPGARDGWLKPGRLTIGTFPGIGWAYLDDIRHRSRHLFEAATVEDLAAQIYVPANSLRETMELVNLCVDGGIRDPYARLDFGAGIRRPPLYAIGPIGIFGGSPVVVGASLATDVELHVLDGAGRPLGRIFAAGGMAESNVFLGCHGSRLSHAFSTGIVAGRNSVSGTE